MVKLSIFCYVQVDSSRNISWKHRKHVFGRQVKTRRVTTNFLMQGSFL